MKNKKKNYKGRTAEEKKEEVEKLLKQLDVGVQNFEYDPEKFKLILEMQALMPTYSFRNIMLIAGQMKSATFVASFNNWKTLNRFVTKGQKSIRILAPQFIKDKCEKTGEEKSKLIGFYPVPVFDVSQTDGEPLPIDKAKLKLDGESDEAVRIFKWTQTLALEDNCPVHIAFANGANGYYSPDSHEIVLDPSLSVNHLAKTAVHELVHSRVHRYSHVNTTPQEMECVAEGVAYIICSYFNLDTSDYSFGYVKGWSGDEGASLMKYGQTIQQTANELISDFERVSSSITTSTEEEYKEQNVS